MRSASSTLYLPAPVGLTASGAIGLLVLAADGHVVLKLAAVAAAGLVGPLRRDGAGVPGVRVGPRDGPACRRRFEGPLLRLGRQPLVALVEHVAREGAQQRAADDGARDGR